MSQKKEEQRSDIRFIRLNNGEDIISQVVETIDRNNNQNFLLVRPLKIVYMATPFNGQTRVALTVVPWVYPSVSNIQEFEIYVNDILTMASPSQTLIKFYDKYWNTEDDYEVSDMSNSDMSNDEFESMSEGDALNMFKKALSGNSKPTLH